MQDAAPVGIILQPHSARGRASLAAILGAAVEVFGAGTQGRPASVAAVAAKIDLSPAAIYQYFPDRRALLLAAIEQDVAYLFDDAIVCSQSYPNPMSPHAFGACLSRFARDHPLAVAAIVDDGRDVSVLPRVQLRIDQCVAMLVSEVRAMQANGICRTDIEVHRVAEAILRTAMFTTVPDRLVGLPDSPRAASLRYLASMAVLQEPTGKRVAELLNDCDQLQVH